MGRDDPFITRYTSFPGIGEGQRDLAVVNSMGMMVVIDAIMQLGLSGFTHHIQIGTEDAPVNSTTSIDDALVWMLADQNAGYAMFPLLCELNFDFVDTGVNSDVMLEVDKEKARYSSGGTAFTPENLSGKDQRTFAGSAYVGTDITAAAKSAVPDSIELARRTINEDVVTDPTTGKIGWDPVIYSVRARPLAVGVDASSLLVHFGAGTADLNGYGVLQIAQLEKGQLQY